MKIKLQRIVLIAALTGVVTAVFALGPQVCQIDKRKMTWTGQKREEGGNKLAEYKCNDGHASWLVVSR